MNINLNNYEAYFLDYHEGILSPSLVKELMEFVASHPELKQELEDFESITLMDSESVPFEQKDRLKKHLTTINSSNFDEYAVEYIEGTLPISLQNDLQTFISQNPHYQKELDLYAKTKLTPDTSLVFDDKLSLKRKQKRPATLYYWSAAASVAILVVAYFILSKSGNKSSNSVAKQEQSKENNITVKQTTKASDTNSAAANNAINNNTITRSIANKRRSGNGTVLYKNSNTNLPPVTVNRVANDIYSLPELAQKPIPLFLENSLGMSSDSLQNIAFINEYIMKYSSTITPQQEDTITETYSEKSGSKFLFALAKITCKGLHIITGQHIRMEKKFDSDTTNIIAYQLDLGKRTYDFPVKE